MPEAETLGYFDHVPVKVADTAVTLSRTGYTGDLGFELTVPEDRAVDVLDAVLDAGRGHGIRPFGEEALMTLRIEAGLALIDIEWHDARLAMSDADTVTPKELGFGWMLRGVRDGSRRFVGLRGDPARAAATVRRGGRPPASSSTGRTGTGSTATTTCSRRSLRIRCPTSRCSITTGRRPQRGRLLHELRLLTGAAAAHRHRPGPPGPRRRPAPSCGSSWPSTTTTPRSGSPRPDAVLRPCPEKG